MNNAPRAGSDQLSHRSGKKAKREQVQRELWVQKHWEFFLMIPRGVNFLERIKRSMFQSVLPSALEGISFACTLLRFMVVAISMRADLS